MFDYNNADHEGLCDYLLDSDFSVCLLSESIEQVWSFIKNTILEAMNLFIPKVKAKVHPKWFNSEIRHTIKCLRTLRRKCSLHPSNKIFSNLIINHFCALNCSSGTSIAMITTRHVCSTHSFTQFLPGVASRFLLWRSCLLLHRHYLSLAYLN